MWIGAILVTFAARFEMNSGPYVRRSRSRGVKDRRHDSHWGRATASHTLRRIDYGLNLA